MDLREQNQFIRYRYTDQVLNALTQAVETTSGRVLVFQALPGAGLTTVLRQCLAATASSPLRPDILAGGHDRTGDLRYKHVERRNWTFDAALDAASELLSLTGAVASIVDPTGAVRLAGSIVSAVGQAGQVVGPARRLQTEQPVEATLNRVFADRRSVSHLRDEIRTSIGKDVPVVVILDDFDRATPSGEWCRLFLSTQLPRLISAHAVTVVIGMHVGSHDDQLQEQMPRESIQTVREMAADELLTVVPLVEADHDEVDDWLQPVSAHVVDDLVSLGGGHPGVIVEVTNQLMGSGHLSRDRGTNRLAYNATIGDLEKASLLERVEDLILQRAGLEQFDRACKILATASLEGCVFTAQALAIALDEDPDELIDWLDDHLLFTEHRAGLVREAGFIGVLDGDQESTRWLNRYEFASRLTWTVIHPILAKGPALSVLGLTSIEATAQSYANALIDVYHPRIGYVGWEVARLCEWAGNQYGAEYYLRDLDSRRLEAGAARGLAQAELRVLNEQTGLSRARLRMASIRLLQAHRRTHGAIPLGESLAVARHALMASWRVHEQEGSLASSLLHADCLAAVADVTYRLDYLADTARAGDLEAAYRQRDRPESLAKAILMIAAAESKMAVFAFAGITDAYNQAISYRLRELGGGNSGALDRVDETSLPARQEYHSTRALEHIERAIAVSSHSTSGHLIADCLVERGKHFSMLRRWAEAETDLRAAIRQIPCRWCERKSEARSMLGQLLRLTSRQVEASECLKLALAGYEVDRNYTRAVQDFAELAILQAQLGDIPRSLESIGCSLQLSLATSGGGPARPMLLEMLSGTAYGLPDGERQLVLAHASRYALVRAGVSGPGSPEGRLRLALEEAGFDSDLAVPLLLEANAASEEGRFRDDVKRWTGVSLSDAHRLLAALAANH